MLRNLLSRLFIVAAITISMVTAKGQSACVTIKANTPVISLSCAVACTTLTAKVPDIRQTSDYSVITVPYAPYPYVTSATPVSSIYIDDKFSQLFTMPFPVCFYDSIYNNMVIGSNGVVTFDEAEAGGDNNWALTDNGGNGNPVPIPFAGVFNGTFTTEYPRAAIFGPYHDINPNTSNAARKIEYSVVGTAPCRKLIISFFTIPMFSCSSQIATQQIVIHESTGIIETFIQSKPICSGWNKGLAILGIQNWAKDKAVAAPGKNCTVWSSNNEGYRWVPTGGASRLVNVQLVKNGAVVATGTVTPDVPGQLNVSFPNVCPTDDTTVYVIRANYVSCSDPSTVLVGEDSVRVVRTNGLNTTATATASNCGATTGTITVGVPTIGTPPYNYILNNGAPQSGNIFSNLAPGTYNVQVVDALNCKSVFNLTVGSIVAITATFNVTGTTCNGASNGAILVNPANGISPYTFAINGGAFSSNNNFTGLASGPHFISIKDAAGCTVTNLQVQVSPGPALAATMAPVNTSCTGVNNGSITVTPTNGSAPYQYSINGGAFQPGNVFSNLAPGTYFISVKDAGNCALNNVQVSIGPGPGISATATATATSCTGVNNGSITITPVSGTGPFQISLNGGAYVPGNTVGSLAPGTYNVTVKDANGCTTTGLQATVAAGTSLAGTAVPVSTSCNGVDNGSITVTPLNGTGPYQYSLNGGAFQASNVFTNLPAGNHTITIKDFNNCSGTVITTIFTGPGLLANAVASPAACNGINNGSITVTPTNGSGPYQYSLNGGAFGPANSFTNLAPGLYNITVKDNNGCTTSGLTANVTAGAAVTATAVAVNTSCNGASNGSITVTPANGSGPYQYSLNGGAFVAGNLFSGLAAGNYTVAVKDASGCTSANVPVTISAGASLTATAAPIATACAGVNNGSVTVTATSGTGPYQYSISNGPQQGPFQSSNVFNGLAPGNYTVIMMDALNCVTAGIPVTITTGAGLQATMAKTDVKCNGAADGSITITPTNGNAPYQYTLNGGSPQLSNTFSNLPPGTYTIGYSDFAGCTSSQQITITEPSLLTGNISVQAAVCNGQNNGSITVTAAGGVAPYQYSLDGVNYQPSNVFNRGAGNYTVYVKDANNCVRSSGISVAEPPVLQASATTQNATCTGGNDGVVTVTATGGNGNYQYSLDGTNFQSSNILNTTPGNLTLTVKDGKDCIVSIPVTVGLTNNLTVYAGMDTTICEGRTALLQAVSNAPNFNWSPGTGLASAAGAATAASPTVTTPYIVTASLGNCSVKDTVVVNVNSAPVANAGTGGVICFGKNIQLGGSGGQTYSWRPAATLSNPNIPNPVATPGSNTVYFLKVTDALGCESLRDDTAIVTVTPPIVASAGRDTISFTGDQFLLRATGGGSIFNWTPATGLSNPNIANPLVTVTQNITYTVVVSTPDGCKGSASMSIKLFNGPAIYMPTGFSPNGNGRNDELKPVYVGIKDVLYFKVYNRWGNELFSTVLPARGWNGTYKGIEQPNDTYIWMVQGRTAEGKLITRKGTVVLIR